MRILIIGAVSKEGSLEYNLAYAARNVGHEAMIFGYAERLPRVNYDLIRFLLEFPSRRLATHISTIRSFYKTLLRFVSVYKPDICLVVKGEILNIKMMKVLHEQCVISFYNPDDPRFVIRSGSLIEKMFSTYLRELIEYVDLIATPCPRCVDIYRELGVKKVIHMPFAQNPKVHYVPIHNRKIKFVLFAGTLYPRRTRILRELIRRGVPVAIYTGSRAQGILLGKWIKKPVWGRKFALLHSMSYIGLNIHIDSDLTWKANMRTFEIPASGTLLLTDNANIIREYFVPGKEIETWDTIDELVEKIKYYLSMPIEDILPIIRRGQIRALEEHSYEDRILKLINSL